MGLELMEYVGKGSRWEQTWRDLKDGGLGWAGTEEDDISLQHEWLGRMQSSKPWVDGRISHGPG